MLFSTTPTNSSTHSPSKVEVKVKRVPLEYPTKITSPSEEREVRQVMLPYPTEERMVVPQLQIVAVPPLEVEIACWGSRGVAMLTIPWDGYTRRARVPPLSSIGGRRKRECEAELDDAAWVTSSHDAPCIPTTIVVRIREERKKTPSENSEMAKRQKGKPSHK
mmetsp:Transcript_35902/g.41626  ORF Transcript_35902/g.41626 Transcript_35902/m.41626 type:complete len:163 (+) Transcript_35902:1376-1864(+)